MATSRLVKYTERVVKAGATQRTLLPIVRTLAFTLSDGAPLEGYE